MNGPKQRPHQREAPRTYLQLSAGILEVHRAAATPSACGSKDLCASICAILESMQRRRHANRTGERFCRWLPASWESEHSSHRRSCGSAGGTRRSTFLDRRPQLRGRLSQPCPLPQVAEGPDTVETHSPLQRHARPGSPPGWSQSALRPLPAMAARFVPRQVCCASWEYSQDSTPCQPGRDSTPYRSFSAVATVSHDHTPRCRGCLSSRE
mmetsp:Transcript_31048/g.71021  ORF Transcript_31048/g.71021 Transcript_31048/m.71021 type:complete len:210 (+) Transcript_31048:269-898(+)